MTIKNNLMLQVQLLALLCLLFSANTQVVHAEGTGSRGDANVNANANVAAVASQPAFLRALQASTDSSSADGDSGDDNSKDNPNQGNMGGGKCEGGCTNNDSCDEGFICYKRTIGENIPFCCENPIYDVTDTSTDINYCVAAGCAAYTETNRTVEQPPQWVLYDDDVFVEKLETLPGNCNGPCGSDKDCRPGLICYERQPKDPSPPCCDVDLYPINITGGENICVYDTCDDPPFNASELALCFSGATTVHVEGKGAVPMEELQIGDQVFTANNQKQQQTYQPVYAFAHLERTRSTDFLQIYINADEEEATADEKASPLEITDAHLVYVEGKTHPVRADTIRVGDILKGAFTTNITATEHPLIHNVTRIEQVRRNGLYAPLTMDGSIVVTNGVLASNYVAVQQSKSAGGTSTNQGYVELASVGVLSWVHQSTLVHMWFSPLRLMCHNNLNRMATTSSTICTSRGSDGLLTYASLGYNLVQTMEQQSLVSQMMVLIPALMILSVFVAVEYLIFLGSWLPWLGLLAVVALYKTCRQEKDSKQ